MGPSFPQPTSRWGVWQWAVAGLILAAVAIVVLLVAGKIWAMLFGGVAAGGAAKLLLSEEAKAERHNAKVRARLQEEYQQNQSRHELRISQLDRWQRDTAMQIKEEGTRLPSDELKMKLLEEADELAEK